MLAETHSAAADLFKQSASDPDHDAIDRLAAFCSNTPSGIFFVPLTVTCGRQQDEGGSQAAEASAVGRMGTNTTTSNGVRKKYGALL